MTIIKRYFSSLVRDVKSNIDVHYAYDLLNKLSYQKLGLATLGKSVVNGTRDLKPQLFGNMLISYARLGHVDDAVVMLKGFKMNDVYACNAILSAYLKKNNARGASIFFEKTMAQFGIKPIGFTYLVYVKCLHHDRQWDLAMSKILEMISLGFKLDEFTYDIYYTNLCKTNRMDQAFELLRNGEIRTQRLLNVFVKQCGLLGDFNNMWAVIAHMWKSGLIPNEFTYERVVSSYLMFGKEDEAFGMIRKTVGEGLQSPRLYNDSLRSCLKRGLHREVRELANQMDSQFFLIQPDLRESFLAYVDPVLVSANRANQCRRVDAKAEVSVAVSV